MSLYFLEKRRKIEGLYQQLEPVRNKQKELILIDMEKLTSDNINFLELEEEVLLTKILKLKMTA